MASPSPEPRSSSSRRRSRASVACSSCRRRRSKCVVAQNQTKCDSCRSHGLTCVILDDDRRKRPVAKAEMGALAERVKMLESMLLEEQQQGQKDPTQPREQQQGQQDPPQPQELSTAAEWTSLTVDLECASPRRCESNANPPAPSVCSSESPASSSTSNSSLLSQMMSNQGHWSYDKTSGRLRYFGSTTNLHIYSDLNSSRPFYSPLEQSFRSELVIRDLSPEAHDYLLDLYWTYYNSVLRVVDKDAFLEDKEKGTGPYYSGFLHVCLLAMGFRFADTKRPEMQALLSGKDRESQLHRDARRLLEYELEVRGGLPSVQALLILGDLECAAGRDNTGWMYVGMACRLALDFGINLDCTLVELEQKEIQIRHMVLWACVVYDRYWALFLGRPTTIRTVDVARSKIDRSPLPSSLDKSLEAKVYEALLPLMAIAGKMTESLGPVASHLSPKAYFTMVALDRELEAWHANLPDCLKWEPRNIREAPASFFLLHQQYHTILILLHRPFARYDVPQNRDQQPHQNGQVGDKAHLPAPDQFSSLSRNMCFENAMRVARIFKQHHTRFNSRQLFITSLDHAGTAATALTAGVACIHESKDRVEPLRHLYCLLDALKAMIPTYRAAEMMVDVLQTVLTENGWDILVEEENRRQCHSASRQRTVESSMAAGEQGRSPKRARLGPIADEPIASATSSFLPRSFLDDAVEGMSDTANAPYAPVEPESDAFSTNSFIALQGSPFGFDATFASAFGLGPSESDPMPFRMDYTDLFSIYDPLIDADPVEPAVTARSGMPRSSETSGYN